MKYLMTAAFVSLALAPQALAIDAYLVAGQSNGWRLSHLKQSAAAMPGDGPRVYYFGMECVSEPTSSTLKVITNLDAGTMGYGLAQALLEASGGEDIVFIQYCRCGAPVLGKAKTSWWPGENPAGGQTFDEGLFGSFQQYLAAARRQVKEKLGQELQFKGLFWHQGEANVHSDKAEFKQAVVHLFQRFRSELGQPELPILAGHIRNLGEESAAINAALDDIAKSDPHMLAVPIADLQYEPDRNGKPDVHIARSGCHQLGRRMVGHWQKLTMAASE